FFFFSSRRRHTRYWRDWSSDVCSSDLDVRAERFERRQHTRLGQPVAGGELARRRRTGVHEPAVEDGGRVVGEARVIGGVLGVDPALLAGDAQRDDPLLAGELTDPFGPVVGYGTRGALARRQVAELEQDLCQLLGRAGARLGRGARGARGDVGDRLG